MKERLKKKSATFFFIHAPFFHARILTVFPIFPVQDLFSFNINLEAFLALISHRKWCQLCTEKKRASSRGDAAEEDTMGATLWPTALLLSGLTGTLYSKRGK